MMTYVLVRHEDFHAPSLPLWVNLSNAHARDHVRTHTEASEHLQKDTWTRTVATNGKAANRNQGYGATRPIYDVVYRCYSSLSLTGLLLGSSIST